ncbi:MAG TPA: cupin domain-containing protein [Candidatus Binatia bacterium]|nr:cupin domain-containing protein [Candidatus Binatia bacterium]
MTTLEGSSQTAERSLDRPVMMFDLRAILGNMKQEATWRTARRNAMTIVKQPIFRIVLVALQAEAEIATHETESPITVQVIEGRLAIHVGADEFVLGAGQLLILGPGLRHTMHAHDDSAFLLTLAAEAMHPAEHLA